MKACFILAVFLAFIWEAKGNCDMTGMAKCRSEFLEEIREDPNNVKEKCEAFKELIECLKKSDCDIPFDLKKDADAAKLACGAASISLNIAVILLTSIVAIKNLL